MEPEVHRERPDVMLTRVLRSLVALLALTGATACAGPSTSSIKAGGVPTATSSSLPATTEATALIQPWVDTPPVVFDAWTHPFGASTLPVDSVASAAGMLPFVPWTLNGTPTFVALTSDHSSLALIYPSSVAGRLHVTERSADRQSDLKAFLAGHSGRTEVQAIYKPGTSQVIAAIHRYSAKGWQILFEQGGVSAVIVGSDPGQPSTNDLTGIVNALHPLR